MKPWAAMRIGLGQVVACGLLVCAFDSAAQPKPAGNAARAAAPARKPELAQVRFLQQKRRLGEALVMSRQLCQGPDSLNPANWQARGELAYQVLGSDQPVPDKPEALEMEAYRSLMRCLQLDRSQRWRNAVQEDLFQLSVQMVSVANLAYDRGLENQNDSAYLTRAAQYYDAIWEMYAQLGPGQHSFRKALAQNSLDVPTIQFFTAVCHDRLGHADKAVALFELLAERGYPDAEVYARLRHYYTQLGYPNIAYDMMRRAHSRMPQNTDVALEMVRLLCEQARWPEAQKMATRLQRTHNMEQVGTLAQAEIYERQRQYPQAERFYQQAVQDSIDPFLAHYYLARFYRRQAGIEPQLQAGSTANGGSSVVASADTAGRADWLNKATHHLEQAYARNPYQLEVRHWLFQAYVQTGQQEKAEDMQSRLR